MLHVLMRQAPSEVKAFVDAPVVVAETVVHDTINVKMACQCSKETNQELFNYYSRDHYFQKPAEGDMNHCLWKIKSQVTKDALGVLPLVPGMRVMVTENIAVNQKVVNGTTDIVEKKIYDTHADGY
jgi:hypothetical protein